MGDLKSPTAIWAKGIMFFVIGLMSAGLLILHTLEWRVVILLCICIWAFGRSYYFAFYVIEHYVDSEYRFAGLFDFLKYALKRRSKSADDQAETK
jgi:hypothetical protein